MNNFKYVHVALINHHGANCATWDLPLGGITVEFKDGVVGIKHGPGISYFPLHNVISVTTEVFEDN